MPRRPLYRRIEEALRQEIAAGQHPVGTHLPTEAELCRIHAVSRHTVREALRRLAGAGLVERRQGAGSLVLAREAPRTGLPGFHDLSALMPHPRGTSLEIRAIGTPPLSPADAALARGAPGEPWLKVEALRLTAPAGPIAQTDILLHPRFAAIAEALPRQGAIHAALAHRFGVEVAGLEQEVSAGLLPPPVAAPLGRRPGEVGLLFLRRHLDARGRILLASRSWHPAEGFVYALRLTRLTQP